MDELKSIADDLLEQFKDKLNINVLVKALDRQLNDVYLFLVDLLTKRCLDEAEGLQLDGIGDIVVMTRDDALALARKIDGTMTMDDATYRKYLTYKISLNTNTCTYFDVIRALKMFWKASPLYYKETPEHPATMFIETPTLKPKDNASVLLLAPKVKAAGVALKVTATTETPVDDLEIGIGTDLYSMTVTQLPMYHPEYRFEETISLIPYSVSVMETQLPVIVSIHAPA